MGEAKQKQIAHFEQNLRFSDEKIGIIKSFFTDNKVLIAVRKVFLQKKLDEVETKIIKGFTKDILDIIENEMIPKLNPDAPLFKVSDWWSTFDFVNMPLEKIAIDVQSREIIVNYLTQQFKFLKGERTNQEILFDDLNYSRNKNLQQGIIELNARNTIIEHLEKVLITFKNFAGEEKETIEQIKERLFKNSNR
jgi:hypothetical protein